MSLGNKFHIQINTALKLLSICLIHNENSYMFSTLTKGVVQNFMKTWINVLNNFISGKEMGMLKLGGTSQKLSLVHILQFDNVNVLDWYCL